MIDNIQIHTKVQDASIKDILSLGSWPEFIRKQERKCTYSVTMRHVRVTNITVEKQEVLYISVCARMYAGLCARVLQCVRVAGHVGVCVCVCVRACNSTYLASNAHAPYCIVIFGLSGPTIFFDIIS